MTEENDVQAPIVEKLDRAIAIIVHNGHKPAAIYLNADDRAALDAHKTRLWRESTGSTAFVWPCAYADVPLIAEKVIQHYEVPVRLRTGCSVMRSTVYGSNGVGVPLDAV